MKGAVNIELSLSKDDLELLMDAMEDSDNPIFVEFVENIFFTVYQTAENVNNYLKKMEQKNPFFYERLKTMNIRSVNENF